MVITFHTEVRFRRIIHRDARNWTTEAVEKFKWSLLFTRRSDSGASHIEMLEIKHRKLSRNSNGHNLSHGGQIQAHNMSRRSKLSNGRSCEIKMVITFHSKVRFRRITYMDAQNWTTEALEKSNGHNFSYGGQIQPHNIPRHWKLNNGSSRDFQMVITFDSEVRFRRITYRDARNWTKEALQKFEWS